MDEMDVFSPLVDVQPITPSLSKWWEDGDEGKGSLKTLDKRSIDFSDLSVARKYPLGEERNGSDVPSWRHSLNHRQDDTSSPTNSPSIRNDPSFLHQPLSLARFGSSAGPAFSSVQDQSTSFNSHSLSQITTATLSRGNLDNSQPGSARLSSYAERLSATSTFNEGLGRTASSGSGASTQIATNGMTEQVVHALDTPVLDQQVGVFSSFSHQLVQRTLEETLGAVQKSIHEDVRNLHIDLIRQFHIQEMNMMSLISELLEKQELLIKEVQLLRQENQQLCQLL